jgi:HAD superfamily hydrolase (TIGR01490 family)
MALAIFDLDNTLLGGDSDYLWGRFLAERGIVDGAAYEAENQRFYADYKAGTLDIHAFLAFALAPLAAHGLTELHALREEYMEEIIEPIVLPKALALVHEHRARGDTALIITATNRFVTEPIAARYGIAHLIATEPERVDGRYTGRVAGIPSFREGKVQRLDDWLATHGTSLEGSWFYSDSHNDLPLLERVDHPVAVDPDATLARIAQERGWRVISLR